MYQTFFVWVRLFTLNGSKIVVLLLFFTGKKNCMHFKTGQACVRYIESYTYRMLNEYIMIRAPTLSPIHTLPTECALLLLMGFSNYINLCLSIRSA